VFNPATKEINSIPLANPPNPFKNGFFYFKTEIKSTLAVKMPLRASLIKQNNTVDMALQKTFLLEQITALELQDRFAKFPTHLVHIGFHVL
jgi:hypothetical protein